MRFRKIETQKGTGKEKQAVAQLETAKSQTADREAQLAVRRDPRTASVPLEWKELAPFVEAHRARQPSEQYLEIFWYRFLPQLKRALRQDELVREYLRQTFWPRWAMRTAAAVLIVMMTCGLFFLREDNRRLQNRVTQLETEIQLLKAGM